MQECFERYLCAFGSIEEKRERFKQTDPDSVWLLGHPDYPPVNAPTLTFDDTLTLNVGNHTFNIIHMPGHTAPQTSVHVPEEGVVFTGDNVFHKCRTWLQECDPWEWLAALESIAALDVETIVPGHGEPCGKAYLKEQARDRRELGRLYRTLCRSRGRAGRDPEEARSRSPGRTLIRSASACLSMTSG